MASLKLASALKKAKSLGRGGDTMLAHINPKEADILKRLGGSGTINPRTGLPEFDNPSMGSYDGAGDISGNADTTGWGGSSNYGGGGNYSNYIGGSDLGGYSGSGAGGGGGGSMASARSADRASVAGYSADPVSANAYGGGGGSSLGVNSPSSAASSLGSALSAGAGISPKGFETLSSGISSIGDAFNGFMSSAPQSLSSLGNQANNTMLGISDSLNNGIASGYSFAKDYISNALNPQAPVNDVSYTQAAAAMGNPGFRSEAAMGNYDYTPKAPAAPAPDFLGNMMNQAAPFGGVEIMSPFTGTPMGVQPSSQQQFLDMLGIQGSPVSGSLPQEAATYSYTPNPDVSYGLRFNPGTIQNAEYIKGAQIKDQFPNVDFGTLTNTDVGRIATRTIAGEAAKEGELGQQLVGSNMMNRLSLADQGFGLPGNFSGKASFMDVMRGYDANGIDSRRTSSNSVYNNPGATTEQNAFNALSAALSPNSAINQARTNPMAAMELASQYGIKNPQDIANAVQSTHYYNPASANPSWGAQMANAAVIGGHRFGSLDTSAARMGAVNTAMTGGNVSPRTFQMADLPSPQAQPVADVPVAPQAPAPVSNPPIGINPNAYPEPLNLPAQPNTTLGKAFDMGFGLTPLGLPNTIAGIFGSSVGDIIANDVNVPRTPEEIQAIQDRQFATNYTSGEGGSQNGNYQMSQASQDAVRRAKSQARTNVAWKADALAYGFTEEQLADREVADLIKQVYDLGFIPKSA